MKSLFNRMLGIVSLLALPALALSGCTGKAPTSATPEPATKPSETIRIGEYTALTGAQATFGQSSHNGVMLAIEERNAAGGIGGRKVELKFYDDKGDAIEAGRVVTRLVNEDKVVALIGGDSSTNSIAGGKIAQQYGIPMVTPASTNPEVTRIGDMIFRACFVDTFQGEVAARFTRDQLKFAKAATLYDKHQTYSKGLSDEFTKQFTRLGGSVVDSEAYTSGDAEFGAQLDAIRKANPEIVFIPGYYGDVAKIAVEAKKMGLKANLLGGDGWDSAQLAALAGDAVDGSYFISHYTTSDPRAKVQEFVKLYQSK